ncbi:iron-containing alcohol dehydrogenase [Kineosporia rhizophila]|uniref:iron-containing alcohol dehydrogenase n=1 Tax=Kineosporia rhizophila TaxID=84633 RepID=UPI001E28EA9D|nr:iron-containing alcohol dehydrogenase [Kineosporia rhizophila]MCE0539273.1 iron-containing alcohol dehydrogenase [Kineosporia rhizophila]
MRATWLSAAHAVESAFVRSGRTTVRLVVDAGVEGAPVHGRVLSWLGVLGARPAGIETLVVPSSSPDLTGPLLPPGDADVTVVVGGGAVLDRVKLATLDHDYAGWTRTRSGLVALRPGPGRKAPLVAVPTTLGTGAEASAVALGHLGERRLLVMDRSLRPTAYAHDPTAYLTLPGALLREGLAEILSRLVGPVVGDAVGEPLTDTVCLALIARLVERADEVVTALDAGHEPGLAALGEAARIGVLGHSDHVQRPHQPWAVKLWALANEVAGLTGGAKIPTTVRLWPAFWAAIDAGAETLGSPAQLRTVWDTVRTAHHKPLPAEPGDGIRVLLTHWGVQADSSCDALPIPLVTERVLRAWGAGLPPYQGVRAGDIGQLLERTRTITPVGTFTDITPPRTGAVLTR